MKIQSKFAEIDVLRGRYALERRLLNGESVILTVTVKLDNDFRAWNDDGTSINFSGEVLRIREEKGTGK